MLALTSNKVFQTHKSIISNILGKVNYRYNITKLCFLIPFLRQLQDRQIDFEVCGD